MSKSSMSIRSYQKRRSPRRLQRKKLFYSHSTTSQSVTRCSSKPSNSFMSSSSSAKSNT